MNLSRHAGYSRLIILFLGHGHKFVDLEAVKAEISSKIIDLTPERCSNLKEIPFLTCGSSIGQRVEIYRSKEGSGMIIEDVEDSDKKVTR